MLVLFETPAGHALFKLLDASKLNDAEELSKAFATSAAAQKLVKLKAFHKFEDTAEAVQSATALVEGKLSSSMRKFLKKNIGDVKDSLAVYDSKLANTIKDKVGVQCVFDEGVLQLMRGLRSQIEELISGTSASEMRSMAIGLSHSLSRYKLKFSPDKVDTMIVQAIGLLDDLDKELNTYAMRLKEWYGWHFPELGKIIPDNLMYAKSIQKMGVRSKCKELDFSDILPEEVEQEMKAAAEISMGTDVSDEDVTNILMLCEQVISLSDYRSQLWDYLKNRMQAIAPNLSVMVGELVGARLIAHAGSLMNLAKQPASTVQILGAEKALFRALKAKHDTPKYGLIYHASLVGQAQPKHKGKISRVLAAKCALSIRVDALGEGSGPTIGYDGRSKVEERMRVLEGKLPRPQADASAPPPRQPAVNMFSNGETTRGYNVAADSTLTVADAKPEKKPKKDKDKETKTGKKEKDTEKEKESSKKEKTEKKEKKEKVKKAETEAEDGEGKKLKKDKKKTGDTDADPKKKKRKQEEAQAADATSSKKKKKT